MNLQTKNKLVRKILACAVGLSLAASSLTALAAPAWTLPETGLKLEGDAKQNYVAEKMDAILHPEHAPQKPAHFAAPDGWEYNIFFLGNFKVEHLKNPAAAESPRVVLQLHGGGYIGGLSDTYRNFAVIQSVIMNAREIFLVDYRLAPKYTYPAALEDAAKVYEEILRRGVEPKNIIVTGDSAGGNLALALSGYLKEKSLPQPGAMVLLSPWTTLETKMKSRKSNAEKDKILGKSNAWMYNGVAKPVYKGKLSAKDPRLSPIRANLTGYPPILVQIGSYEIFRDEGIELLRKAANDDVEITLTVYPEMSHVFSLIVPELQESVDSFKEIKNFVDVHLPITTKK